MSRFSMWGAACVLTGLLMLGAQEGTTSSSEENSDKPANPMPDLLVSEWYNVQGFDLEDYRGQVVMLVFYDDANT